MTSGCVPGECLQEVLFPPAGLLSALTIPPTRRLAKRTGMHSSTPSHFGTRCFQGALKMATHSSVLACRTPGMGEPGGWPSMGSHRVGHD